MHDVMLVQVEHRLHDLAGVFADHALSQALLGHALYRAFGAVLHEDQHLVLA